MKKILLLLVCAILLPMIPGCKNQADDSEETIQASEEMTSSNSNTSIDVEKEDPNMISHWTMDTIGENNLVMDSAKRKNGTAQNCKLSNDAISGASVLIQPSVGSYVSFDTKITDALKDTGEITLAFWYYSMTSLLQKPYVFCLSMEDGKPGFSIQLTSTNVVVTARSCKEESAKIRTYSCSGWSEWIHLAVSVNYKTGTVRLYRNGIEVTPGEGAVQRFRKSSYDPGTPKYSDSLGGFAEDHFNSRIFSGKIDEVYLFSKAASAEEIMALYADGKGVVTPSETEALLYSKLSILTGVGNTVLSANSNVVLHNSDRCYLVPGDASQKVTSRNDVNYAPAAFFKAYRNTEITETQLQAMDHFTENGQLYVSVSDFATVTKTDIATTKGGRIVLGKSGIDSDLADFIDRYYNGETELLPTPEIDIYNSRTPVKYSDVITNRISLGSPSMLKLSNGNLLASYDYNGKKYTPVSGGTNDAGVSISTDGGNTWTEIAIIPRMLWGSLFEIGNSVYLMGRDTATLKLAIVKSIDGGYTWTDIANGQIDPTVGMAHRAPTPAVFYNGRVYIACEDSADENGVAANVPTKRAYMMSASVDADLLDPDSWTKSNCVSFDTKWLDDTKNYGGSNTGLGFYEGNAVCGKNGTMYIISRVDSDPYCGIAVILKLSSDNQTLVFERRIDLPIGKDKFVIRYDEGSQKYIAIGNTKTSALYPTQRNVLAMYCSEDLIHWEYVVTLLSDNTLTMVEKSVQNYGYQYPDFVFDGDDILLLVREASGNTTYWHDANYISFFTIPNFRNLLVE